MILLVLNFKISKINHHIWQGLVNKEVSQIQRKRTKGPGPLRQIKKKAQLGLKRRTWAGQVQMYVLMTNLGEKIKQMFQVPHLNQ